jgi:16S rRNA (guanine(1405)-N(7))-methyltransferase
MPKDSLDIDQLVTEVSANPKYAVISEELVRRVGAQELAKGRSFKEAIKATRNKLHQVGGAYQEGGIRYSSWIDELERLPGDLRDPSVQDFCRHMMVQHVSSKERLPILETFFARSLASLAPVRSVLDVACGLNPLAMPWMPLREGAEYYACDIYTDLVEFLNLFFQHFGIHGEASVCDLTAQIPRQPAQVVFLLKTLPCLEQLDKTISARLLAGVRAENLLVSFPSHSLGGRSKGMPEFYEAHFRETVQEEGWEIEKVEFSTELAFVVKKG